MASGLEIRANIDAEIFKTLVLIHGGGSVALLTFLPFVLREGFKFEGEALAHGILWGLVCYQAGIASAVIYSWLTRKCSLKYQQQNMPPPPCGNFLGIKLTEPCACHARIVFMFLSLVIHHGRVLCISWWERNARAEKGHRATGDTNAERQVAVKVVYKITYPTGKIYIGKDSTNSARYMGSPNRLLINADFKTLSEEARQSYSLHKEILWQSETATEAELSAKEVEFIRKYKANDPRIGFNRWPKFKDGG